MSSSCCSESTPLLHGQPEADESQVAKPPPPTPLPVGQFAVTCLIRMVDPIAYTQVFPYMNEFVSKLGITDDPSRVGYYSGLIESCFALTQLCVVYHWARLSDKIGRKPVIYAGLSGLIISTLVFGLGKSFTMLLVGRSIAGLFSGNSAVVTSILAELTGSDSQAVAYSIYGVMWPLGSIIGPMVGGRLSNPASKYPLLDFELLRKYPYFLPSLFTSLVATLGILAVFSFLKETLPSRQPGYNKSNANPTVPVAEIFRDSTVKDICITGVALSFMATAHDVLFTLFCFTPVKSGGLGFSPSRIGDLLALSGGLAIVIQLLLAPPLLRRFSAGKLYAICMACWPVAFIVLPLGNYAVSQQLENSSAWMWTALCVSLLFGRCAEFSYMLSTILVNQYASPRALASTNALVHVGMCCARAFSPVMASSLFAWSIKREFVGGYVWALAVGLVGVLGISLTKRIAKLG